MDIGTITIDDNGNETAKTGAAGRRYDVLKARLVANLAGASPPGSLPGAGPERARFLRAIASVALDDATWLVTEVTGHAKARVAVGGLQKASGTPTDAPDAPVEIPIV